MTRCKTVSMLSAIVLIITVTPFSVLRAADDVTQEARTVVQSLQTAFQQQDVDKIMELLHPQFDMREEWKKSLQQGFEIGAPSQVRIRVQEVTSYDAGILVKVTTSKTRQANDPPVEKTELYVLKSHEGRLKILGMYEPPTPGTFDAQTRLFSGVKGKFSVTVPAGWLALQGSGMLKALTADAMIVLAPDLQSKVMLGVVQLPLKLGDTNAETAQKAALGDMALERRIAADHVVLEEGPTRVADLDGYRLVVRFKDKDTGTSVYQRQRIYLADHPMLYFFVCDAIGGAQSYDTLESQFTAIVSSFDLLPVDTDLSRQEALAAEQATGSVTGRVYTSDEYNCFIAAPEGWQIRTSPNPAHLAEMQYTAGKSIARLIATKGLPDAAQLNDVFTSRLQQVKGIVENFVEVSRQDVTLQDTPGIESVHTYSLEQFGSFHVKEWTLIRDNTYYLILCQCIEPDDFATLESDFDRIIESFGFMQD